MKFPSKTGDMAKVLAGQPTFVTERLCSACLSSSRAEWKGP